MKKIVFTDLDRTLFTVDGKITERNYQSLLKLGERGIIRVIVTGRNLYSAHAILASDFPIDYLVISSGAGIIDFRTKKILAKQEIDNKNVQRVIKYLQDLDVDFMIHFPIPENHYFEYYTSTYPCSDAQRRIQIYQQFAYPYSGDYVQKASQFLAIVESEKEMLVEHAIESLPDLSIIRATSPIDHKSVWIEIFPTMINKGYACKKIINKLDILPSEVLTIGNDYNDYEMLSGFPNSYVVANSPQFLQDRFTVVGADYDSGFSEMLTNHFDFIK